MPTKKTTKSTSKKLSPDHLREELEPMESGCDEARATKTDDEIRNDFDERVREIMEKRLGGPMATALNRHFGGGHLHAEALSEDLSTLSVLLEKQEKQALLKSELEILTRGVWSVISELQLFENYLQELTEARYLAVAEAVRGEVRS